MTEFLYMKVFQFIVNKFYINFAKIPKFNKFENQLFFICVISLKNQRSFKLKKLKETS